MEGKIEIGTKSKQLYDKMRKSHLRGVEKSEHRNKQRNDKTENLILRLVMCVPWRCRKKLKSVQNIGWPIVSEPKLNKFAKKAMSVQLSRKIASSVKCT